MGKQKHGKRETKAKLIYNPHAGGAADPTARLAEAVYGLEQQGLRVDVAVVSPAEQATAVASAAAERGYRLIVAMGGDGTIEAVARALVGSKARLGIIPAGTFNNVAKSLGIPADIEAACAILGAQPHRRIDVGQARGKRFGTTYFLEMVAVGLIAQMFPEGNDFAKHRWGRLIDAAGELIRFRSPKVHVRLGDDSQLESETPLVLVANTPAFGETFLVAPDAMLDDGMLDVSIYTGFSKAALYAYLARVANDGHESDGHVERYRARRIKITARPRQSAVADSQLLGKGRVTIKVRRHALRVVAPKHGGLAHDRTHGAERLPVPAAPGSDTSPVSVSDNGPGRGS
jgi:diacylglycerol kinase (ATP)